MKTYDLIKKINNLKLERNRAEEALCTLERYVIAPCYKNMRSAVEDGLYNTYKQELKKSTQEKKQLEQKISKLQNQIEKQNLNVLKCSDIRNYIDNENFELFFNANKTFDDYVTFKANMENSEYPEMKREIFKANMQSEYNIYQKQIDRLITNENFVAKYLEESKILEKQF